MTTPRRRARGSVPERVECPPELAGRWFVELNSQNEPIPGIFTHVLKNAHALTGDDVYVAEFMNGDFLNCNRVEAMERLAAEVEAPEGGLQALRKARIEADRVASEKHTALMARLTNQTKIKGSRGKSNTRTATSATKNDADTEHSTDGSSAPKAKGSKKKKGKGKKAGKDGSGPEDMQDTMAAPILDGDSLYGSQYTVEGLVDAKYAISVKYKVRWKGDWDPSQKESLEEADNLNPGVIKRFELKSKKRAAEEAARAAIDEMQAFSSKVTDKLRRTLVFLQPQSWLDAGHKSFESMTAQELSSFDLTEFTKIYHTSLQSVLKRRIKKLNHSQKRAGTSLEKEHSLSSRDAARDDEEDIATPPSCATQEAAQAKSPKRSIAVAARTTPTSTTAAGTPTKVAKKA
eukprot:m.109344 g.109344  ORF g.109344 m.109344 type:complete len:404 (+) comp13375_c0_seq2:119-1330(+)